MESYQIGNKVTCIIRAYSPCTIGDTVLTYKNEPYTILEDVSVTLSFTDKERDANTDRSRELAYNNAYLNSIRLSDVHLTDKVLHMLYRDFDESLKSKYDQVESDEEGRIYLSTIAETIYQVFIYDDTMTMVQAYGSINPDNLILTPNQSYLVVYQEPGNKAVSLYSPQNLYYTLDLICKGNISEQTSDSYIHIEKAGIRIDRQMTFSRTLNAVDITFNVITTKEDYIVLK